MIERITEVNDVLNGFIWGATGLVLLIGTGVLMTFCTKFFQVFHIGHWFKQTIGSLFKRNSASTKKINIAIPSIMHRSCGDSWYG